MGKDMNFESKKEQKIRCLTNRKMEVKVEENAP